MKEFTSRRLAMAWCQVHSLGPVSIFVRNWTNPNMDNSILYLPSIGFCADTNDAALATSINW